MKLEEAKELLRRMLAEYFGDEHAFYSEVKLAENPEPYVCLQATEVETHQFPVEYVRDDEFCRQRQYKAMFDINLYTRGRNVAKAGQKAVYLNTAQEDLQGFLDFLDSEYILIEEQKNDISFMAEGNIQDMSALVNNNYYQYRAMIEISATFSDYTYGYKGQNNETMLPNYSGGGSPEMVMENDVIEEVEGLTAKISR